MLTNNDILRISDLLDKKLRPFSEELHQAESRLDAKITQVEASLEAKISQNGSDIHQINLTLENTIIPRLQDIESCYTDTYDRYRIAAEESYGMKADIEILKNVAQEHSLKLQGGVVL